MLQRYKIFHRNPTNNQILYFLLIYFNIWHTKRNRVQCCYKLDINYHNLLDNFNVSYNTNFSEKL